VNADFIVGPVGALLKAEVPEIHMGYAVEGNQVKSVSIRLKSRHGTALNES
jgi:hypothetical protein